jgi:UDP-N-acetylglucosamine 2-epimerase (non-hydrolysing)
MQHKQTLSDLTCKVISGVTTVISKINPSAVLVQGDTTSVLATALAAFYQNIQIGHIEAGLRTWNMSSPFPEEMNRRLSAPLASWNFCPTPLSYNNLVSENIDKTKCYITGNTVIDALLYTNLKLKSVVATSVSQRLGISREFSNKYLSNSSKRWLLVTGHRRESFGSGIERICETINHITNKYDVGIVFPMHLNPHVQEPVIRLLGGNHRIALVKPANYEDFIWLLNRCAFVLTDSGGVQEEAPSLGKPVLVMRETTERPEGVHAGTCTLVGTNPKRILDEVEILLSNQAEYIRRTNIQNPYGDGKAAEYICEILERSLIKL